MAYWMAGLMGISMAAKWGLSMADELALLTVDEKVVQKADWRDESSGASSACAMAGAMVE